MEHNLHCLCPDCTQREIQRLRAEVERLRQQREEYPREMLMERADVTTPEDLCPVCGGWGVRAYAGSSGWCGGISGQAVTSDVCDHCWGTGSKLRKGADLRTLRAEVERLRAVIREYVDAARKSSHSLNDEVLKAYWSRRNEAADALVAAAKEKTDSDH